MILLVVAVYLCGLLLLGLSKASGVDSQESFSLAKRGLGPFVLVGTLVATWTGTGSIFGLAEEAYGVGFAALILPLGTAVGLVVLAVLCRKVRAKGRYTLQDILEERFGPVARILGTLTLVIAYLVIISYQLRAGGAVAGRIFESQDMLAAGGMAPWALVAVVALFIATYTALAGMAGVSVTDTVNGILMISGLLIALPVIWSAAGGMEGIEAAFAGAAASSESASFEDVTLVGPYTAIHLISYILPLFLLVIGDANLHQRFLSARSDSVARRGALLLIPAVLIVDAVIILVAVAGRAVVPSLENPGHVVMELALGALPPLLGAILVASILAVIISTADSYLLASATSLVRDVYQRFFKKDASEQQLLTTSRVAVFVLAGLAFLLSFTSQEFFDVALFAYTIYGVGITPALLAALFWKRATPAGAITGMVSAVTLAVIWKIGELGRWSAEVLDLPAGAEIDAVVPSILVAVVLLVVVSLVTTPRPVTGETPR